MAMLLSLPDELLLAIGDHFHGKTRNRNLRNLSLVCHRLRDIAQEKLLCSPSFQLTHIHSYLWALAHHANLQSKVTTLEIFSSSKDRVKALEGAPRIRHLVFPLSIVGYVPGEYPAMACPPEIDRMPGFKRKCEEVIRFYAQKMDSHLGTVFASKWCEALENDIIQAMLIVLLVVLPNLKELYIAAAWLMDFPLFSEGLHGNIRNNVSVSEPSLWFRHKWMEPIYTMLKHKLSVLEFPADWMNFGFHFHTTTVFDFSTWSCLRYISVPMAAIFWSERRRSLHTGDSHIFPPTLELLRISECTVSTLNFMNELCLAKKQGHYPRLRCVELYFSSRYSDISEQATRRRTPHVEPDIRRMFKKEEMELFAYFPRSTDVGTSSLRGTPWSLAEEGTLLKAEEEIPGNHIEPGERAHCGHWDADGDVVMRRTGMKFPKLLG